MEQCHKSQNAPCAHFCSEWSIVWYETGAFWELWIKSIAPISRYLLNKHIKYTNDIINPSLHIYIFVHHFTIHVRSIIYINNCLMFPVTFLQRIQGLHVITLSVCIEYWKKVQDPNRIITGFIQVALTNSVHVQCSILNDLWKHFKRLEGFVTILVEAFCPYISYTGS